MKAEAKLCSGIRLVLTVLATCLLPLGRAGTAEPRPEEPLLRTPQLTVVARHGQGAAAYLVRTSARAKSGVFDIEIVLDLNLCVVDCRIVSYPLSHGRNIMRRGFAGRFLGKSPAAPMQLGVDLDAVSGATLSCAAMANAVRTALRAVAEQLPRQIAEPPSKD